MDKSNLDNSFLEGYFDNQIMNDNSCRNSINRNEHDLHLNVNNHIPNAQPNTGIPDGRSHQGMSLVQQTNEQPPPQRSDCMHQARTSAPQPGYSGISSRTHTVPGTGDYSGFNRSTPQNGYQGQSEAPATYSRINYPLQDDHQNGYVANTSSVLGSGQQHQYLAGGQLPVHTNIQPLQFQISYPAQASTSSFYDGYPASTVNTHPTNVNNHVGLSGSANSTGYEALSMACDYNIPVGQSMPYNHQNVIPLPVASYSSHGTSNSIASTSGMQMDQFMAQLRPQTDRAGVMQQTELSTLWNQMANPMPCNSGIVVPQHMQAHGSSAVTTSDEKKPSASYLRLIADALLASEQGMLVVGEICEAIMNKYAYYRNCNPTWKGGIRHNLSVNNCFYMAKASNMGRGHLWAIHYSCLDYFRKGTYDRRAVNQIVQHWHNQNGSKNTAANEQSSSQLTVGDPPAATDGSHSSSPSIVTASSAQQEDAPAPQD